jgi:hypothetical protein
MVLSGSLPLLEMGYFLVRVLQLLQTAAYGSLEVLEQIGSRILQMG